MKKGLTLVELLAIVVIIAVLVSFVFVSVKGCNQISAKSFGGTMALTLDPGRKLVNATWKDKQIWLLTTVRSLEDKPQTYVFEERSTCGILQGKVVIEEK